MSRQSVAPFPVVFVSECCSDVPAAGLSSVRAWVGRGSGLHHGYLRVEEATKPLLQFLPLSEILCYFSFVKGPLTVVVKKSYPC